MHPLQEKFQIITHAGVPATTDSWVPQSSVRQSQASVPAAEGRFNQMPPGIDNSNQCSAEINAMPRSLAGSTDVTNCAAPRALHPDKGFTKHEMKGTDDSYTGEHVDHFYGDSGGFVERNNYLDRA